MTLLRRLPLRLDRAPYEPLFSWAAAATRTTQTSLNHLSQVWEVSPRSVLGDDLTAEQREQLEYTSRLEAGSLRNQPHPLAGLWPVQAAYRFCAPCIGRGGRWSELWGLPWELICPIDGCGLSTVCPKCGRRPNASHVSVASIVDSKVCGVKVEGTRVPCGGPLAEANRYARDDPRFTEGAVWRRRFITEAGAAASQEQPAEVQVGGQPIPASWAVLDLRLLTLVLRRLTPSAAGVVRSVDGAPEHLIGLTDATYVLRADSTEDARQRMQQVFDEHHIRVDRLRNDVSAVSGLQPSPWLQTVLLAVMPPADLRGRLGERTDTSTPGFPLGRLSSYHEQQGVPVFSSTGLGRGKLVDASWIPTLLWAGATEDIVGTATWNQLMPNDRRQVRTACSMMLLATGNIRTWNALARELDTAFDRVVRWAGEAEELDERLPRLFALAEALADTRCPIDYRRRRHLFPELRYPRPLEIRRRLHAAGIRCTQRAIFMAKTRTWELLTGSDAMLLIPGNPHALVERAHRSRYEEFVEQGGTRLDDLLAIEVEHELLRQYINEPAMWRPRLHDTTWDLADTGPPRSLTGWTAASHEGRLREESRAGDLTAVGADPLAAVVRGQRDEIPRRRLENFQAVALCHGFSAAARDLGVAESVLSQQVGVLEQRLGRRLLNRSTSHDSLSLTAEGRALYDAATRILGQHPLSVGRRPLYDPKATDAGRGVAMRRAEFARPKAKVRAAADAGEAQFTRQARAWAVEQGLKVGQFGTLPLAVLQEYQRSCGTPEPS